MPNWKDELKAEIESVRDSLIPPIAAPFVYMKDNKEKAILELCALILELIDHIPEEQEPK